MKPLCSSDSETPQFGRDFEHSGGLTLTPEEFLAALNPEFMIEFAKPYLGNGHLSILSAQAQLENRDYIGSLITIRTALKPFAPSLVKPISTQPSRFQLHQNYPNPFNPFTTIQFDLPFAQEVTLKIFNILGQEVQTLVKEHLPTGSHRCRWEAKGLASGVYFYKLHAGEFVATRKLILLR
jgi:hypothetical protein